MLQLIIKRHLYPVNWERNIRLINGTISLKPNLDVYKYFINTSCKICSCFLKFNELSSSNVISLCIMSRNVCEIMYEIKIVSILNTRFLPVIVSDKSYEVLHYYFYLMQNILLAWEIFYWIYSRWRYFNGPPIFRHV